MVGEGVVHTCLADPMIEDVLVVARRSMDLIHPKLREILITDFMELDTVAEQLHGFDACYFCLGVSSLGISEEEYYRLTYSLTMQFAKTVSERNPNLVFCYVSGKGTDGTEKGRIRWARVKGKTENDLQKWPFKAVYNFRPGFIKPIRGLKFTNPWYKYIRWMFPIGRKLSPGNFVTLSEIGRAMIHVTRNGYPSTVLEGKDIIKAGRD